MRLTRERALNEAQASDARRKAGNTLGLLDGIPYAVKDIYDVAGLPTMAGTDFLPDDPAALDCNAVRRLSDSGMVLVAMEDLRCQPQFLDRPYKCLVHIIVHAPVMTATHEHEI